MTESVVVLNKNWTPKPGNLFPKIESIDNSGKVTILFPTSMSKTSCSDLINGTIKFLNEDLPNMILKINRNG
jgi:hypothetical protein